MLVACRTTAVRHDRPGVNGVDLEGVSQGLGVICFAAARTTGLITLRFSKKTQIHDLMPVREAGGCDQSKWPKQQACHKPAPAVSRFLAGDCF